jgi:predicted nucleic acid-binding protein
MTTLVDTNILVYAAGIRADERRKHMATELLAQLRPDACLSLQVLSEFSAIGLRHGISPEVCRSLVAEYCHSWTVLAPSAASLDAALAAVRDHQFSFWDAMLWAVAHENGLGEIVTEDGPTGAVIGGVKFRNPFAR